MLTPFLPDGTIDAAALGAFIETSYGEAGYKRADIDSGAVILTGEAIKRRTAQPCRELFGRVFGHDAPAADDHDALAHGGGFGKNVGAQDDGMGSSQILDQLSDFENLFRIEADRRFIQD